MEKDKCDLIKTENNDFISSDDINKNIVEISKNQKELENSEKITEISKQVNKEKTPDKFKEYINDKNTNNIVNNKKNEIELNKNNEIIVKEDIETNNFNYLNNEAFSYKKEIEIHIGEEGREKQISNISQNTQDKSSNLIEENRLMGCNDDLVENIPESQKNNRGINIFKKTDISQGSSYDFIFKIALIGDSGIGKTSILIRFVDDLFKNDTTSTIGVDFKLVSFKIEDKLAKMQIWDTCGSERFKSLTSSFIKSCSVFVLVFDLTKQKSFLNLESWIKLIKENVNPKLLCLVGNKSDLEDQRQVTLEEAIKFSNKHELKYLETSARTNFGIEKLFSYIAEKLYDDTINLRKIDREEKKKKNSKKNSKAFEIGPSSNLSKDNKKHGSESEDDSDEDKKKGKKLTTTKNNSKIKKCSC